MEDLFIACLSACAHTAELLSHYYPFSSISYCRCILISAASSADMWSLFIPHLSASGRDKPSCLKVVFVKIIYENFSFFFLGNFD